MVWPCKNTGEYKDGEKGINIEIYRKETYRITEKEGSDKYWKTSRRKKNVRRKKTGDFASIIPYKIKTMFKKRYNLERVTDVNTLILNRLTVV
jgi:hypothetical protein